MSEPLLSLTQLGFTFLFAPSYSTILTMQTAQCLGLVAKGISKSSKQHILLSLSLCLDSVC